MGNYQRKDHFYRKAKAQGLPSRASFKIEEILSRFKPVREGDAVIDLGAAPGGWTVILARAVGPAGKVLALDLQSLRQDFGPRVEFAQMDAFSPEARDWLKEKLQDRNATGVFSDLSPKLSGIPFKDAYLSYELGLRALELARRFLKEQGSLVVKQFPGEEYPEFLKEMRKYFEKVKTFEPKSSRKTSREVYVLGLGFKRTEN